MAAWPTALGPGFTSAVFDNMALTALAIKQGDQERRFLAHVVGFFVRLALIGFHRGSAPRGSARPAAVARPSK